MRLAFNNIGQIKNYLIIMQSLSLQVASVKEVFRLQRDDELIDAESKYLPVK